MKILVNLQGIFTSVIKKRSEREPLIELLFRTKQRKVNCDMNAHTFISYFISNKNNKENK